MAILIYFLIQTFSPDPAYKVRCGVQEVQLIYMESDTLKFFPDGTTSSGLLWSVRNGEILLDAAPKTAN